MKKRFKKQLLKFGDSMFKLLIGIGLTYALTDWFGVASILFIFTVFALLREIFEGEKK